MSNALAALAPSNPARQPAPAPRPAAAPGRARLVEEVPFEERMRELLQRLGIPWPEPEPEVVPEPEPIRMMPLPRDDARPPPKPHSEVDDA